VCLDIEFERVIGVREVLLRLFFDFPVSFDPIKKLGAVTLVFGLSRLINFKSFVMLLFLFLSGLSVVAGQILATGESSGIKNCASAHHRNTSHIATICFFFLTGWKNLLVFEVLLQRDAAGHDSGELCIAHDVAAGVRGEVLFHHLFRNLADAGG